MQQVQSGIDTAAWTRLRQVGLREMMCDYERRLIATALEECDGCQRRAAEMLGLLPSTLCERMKRLGFHRKTTFTFDTETHH